MHNWKAAINKKSCREDALPPPIYYVYIEDYLKPKQIKKRRNSLLWATKPTQKNQLRLKLLEHPVLVAGSKTKWTLFKDKLKKLLEKIFKKPILNNFSSSLLLGNIKLPRFLNFLNARNDEVTCKRKSGFEIYCELASIHGFNNFVGATTWQRAYWFLVILIAVIMSGFVLLLSNLLNVSTPTLLYSESTQYPSWSIPFPAVTICNLNRISKNKAENLAHKFLSNTNTAINTSYEDLLSYFKLALYTTENVAVPDNNMQDHKRLNEILSNNNYTLLKVLDHLTPDCITQLKRCSFKGYFSDCHKLFTKTKTAFGQCCSFNYHALKKIVNKRTNYNLNNHVQYISNCGYVAGLSVLLDPDLKDYKASSTLTSGFRVLIHDAHDFPDTTTMQRIITSATTNKISVSPYQIYATEHISSLEVNSRRCYLPNERKMYHFGSYSQINCLAECHALMMYEKCHCTLPFRPKMHNWTICGLKDITCFNKYKSILTTDLKYTPSHTYKKEFLCDCYPLCDTHMYNIAMDSGGLNRRYSKTEKQLFKNVNVTDHILLRVFISDLYAERSRLDVYENWLTFLGTFGGITGLFMGYSFLSGFELIFFVFVRPACNWLTKKRIAYRVRTRQRKAQLEKEKRKKLQQEQQQQQKELL